MIKSKKQSLIVIGAFTLVMLLGTVTYAFFNYTRTGSSNVIKTGRISFTSSQDGIINLTNVFPITSSEAETDTTNTDEVVITITGDTTYTGGIEYLVTLEDVNIETSTNKKIPVGLIVTPEVDDTELGTENTNYFNTGVRGGNTSYYKVLADDTVKDGEYVLVGYIRPGQAEVNGKIGIKAYLDASKILISDTYDGTESDNMGTLNSMAEGKTVLTTNEWNSIQGNNAISFKVRVQANEGIWVGEPLSRNDMTNISSTGLLTADQKSSITEINFIRMSEEMIDTHSGVIDITAVGGQGVVKAWIDGTKLYIASPGETYFPVNSSYLFTGSSYRKGFTNLEIIKFGNINTTLVENMEGMFQYSLLEYIDLDSFNTSNVSNMMYMFQNCANLVEMDISGFDTSNVTNMSSIFSYSPKIEKINMQGLGSNNLDPYGCSNMFDGCNSLKEINLSDFNFGATSLNDLLKSKPYLEVVNLSGANTSKVTSMNAMFSNDTSLKKIDLSGLGGDYLTNIGYIFDGCTNLEEINMSNFNFGTSTISSLFQRMSKLKKVNLSHADTSQTTGSNGISYMFQDDTNLLEVDLSYFNATVSMNYLFENCTNLKSVNLSHFDTSNVTMMNAAFRNCSSLTNVDFSYFSFNNVNTMYDFIRGCSSLTRVDLSNKGGRNLSNISDMFTGCTSIREINMSGFDFGSASLGYLYRDLGNVETIDLSNVNISNVQAIWQLFKNCRKLKTIYVSNTWNVENVNDSSEMFTNTTSLVGGSGTVYDANHIDKEYARIDGGTSNPGYLTLKTN